MNESVGHGEERSGALPMRYALLTKYYYISAALIGSGLGHGGIGSGGRLQRAMSNLPQCERSWKDLIEIGVRWRDNTDYIGWFALKRHPRI